MNVLLVGGGGRECALAWRIAKSPILGDFWVTHDNPGFPAIAKRLPEGPLARRASEVGVDLVVVGPEAPLADGLVDECMALGVSAFGPQKSAAQLEASKGFAKDFMSRHGIPTAAYARYENKKDAIAGVSGPCVVKADGLAAGKGVMVCTDRSQAIQAIETIFDGAYGEAGASIVVEELLEGPEVSLLALSDGHNFVSLPPAQDHKRRYDGDKGPNTGGMGAYAPVDLPEGLVESVEQEVVKKVLEGMAEEGMVFRGVLYVGLMLTPDGPKVLEFNCRFGDPECQPLLMLLNEDLLPILKDCADGKLKKKRLSIRSGASCCVVMASGEYPGSVEKGHVITGLEHGLDDVVVFQAGTKRLEDMSIVNDGGRVLGVTAYGNDFEEARARAYQAIEGIHWKGADWRKDIGWRAIREQK